MDPSLGGLIVGVTWSFSFHPRHLLFAELSLTGAKHDPRQGLKGQATMLVGFGGSLGALRHCSRGAGAFPSPLYSLWLRSLTTSESSLGPLHESRRTAWT